MFLFPYPRIRIRMDIFGICIKTYADPKLCAYYADRSRDIQALKRSRHLFLLLQLCSWWRMFRSLQPRLSQQGARPRVHLLLTIPTSTAVAQNILFILLACANERLCCHLISSFFNRPRQLNDAVQCCCNLQVFKFLYKMYHLICNILRFLYLIVLICELEK